MANVSFKFGNYANLVNQAYEAGRVYITADERGLYFDRPLVDNETTGSVDTHRIKIAGDVIVKDSVQATKPPYNPESLYYFITDNLLAYYTGNGVDNHSWNVVNDTAVLESIGERVVTLENKMTAAEGNIKTNTEGIAANKTAIATNTTNITANADAIKLKADATTVTSLSNTVDALSKTHTNDKKALEDSIAAVKETADTNKANLETLSTSVTNLTATVDTKVDKTTYDSAIENINTEIGKKVDQSAYNTKIKALEDADSALTGTVNDIINEIGNLSNIMNFRGVATTSDGEHFTVTDGKGDFKLGDVVIVTSGDYSGQEYVCITEGTMGAEGSAVFEEIGSTKATDAGLAALQQTVSDLTATVDTKVNKTDYDTAISDINEKVSSLKADKVDKSTYNEKIAALEKADSDLNSSVSSKADQSALESGLAEKVAQSEYNAKVEDFEKRISENTTAVTTTLPNQITDAIDNALAWGTF